MGNRMLPLLMIGFLVLAAGGAAFFILSQPQVPTQDQLAPTPIRPPDVNILHAIEDIPANRLLTDADMENLFESLPVNPDEVLADDVRADEFSTRAAGQVTVVQIAAGNRLKTSSLRPAGIAEKIPTAQPGQGARKAMTIYVPDLGDILAVGNTVDVLGSYNVEQPYLRYAAPGGNLTIPGLTTELAEGTYLDVSTKVIAQNVPVLDVISPPPGLTDENGNPLPAPPPSPTVDPELVTPSPGAEAVATPRPVYGQGARWTVVVAVTDQEAELIKYSMDRTGGVLSLIVRRSDDLDTVTTTGVTMDVLTRLYSVPMVYPQPEVLLNVVRGASPPLPPNQPANELFVPVPLPGGQNPPGATTAPPPTAAPAPGVTPTP